MIDSALQNSTPLCTTITLLSAVWQKTLVNVQFPLRFSTTLFSSILRFGSAHGATPTFGFGLNTKKKKISLISFDLAQKSLFHFCDTNFSGGVPDDTYAPSAITPHFSQIAIYQSMRKGDFGEKVVFLLFFCRWLDSRD
jgi:hypothetical protein